MDKEILKNLCLAIAGGVIALLLQHVYNWWKEKRRLSKIKEYIYNDLKNRILPHCSLLMEEYNKAGLKINLEDPTEDFFTLNIQSNFDSIVYRSHDLKDYQEIFFDNYDKLIALRAIYFSIDNLVLNDPHAIYTRWFNVITSHSNYADDHYPCQLCTQVTYNSSFSVTVQMENLEDLKKSIVDFLKS